MGGGKVGKAGAQKIRKAKVQMTGSEKQVSWAKDIQAATLETVDYLMAEMKKLPQNDQVGAVMSRLAKQKEAIENCEKAWNMIDVYSGIRARDKIEDRARAFSGIWRAHKPQNDEQSRMLGR